MVLVSTGCNLFCFLVLRSDKEEKGDLKNYKMKAQNLKKKKQVLSSIYSEWVEFNVEFHCSLFHNCFRNIGLAVRNSQVIGVRISLASWDENGTCFMPIQCSNSNGWWALTVRQQPPKRMASFSTLPLPIFNSPRFSSPCYLLIPCTCTHIDQIKYVHEIRWRNMLRPKMPVSIGSVQKGCLFHCSLKKSQ